MTRDEAILELWSNYDITVSHAPATPEEREVWDAGFVEAMEALGVSNDEINSAFED